VTARSLETHYHTTHYHIPEDLHRCQT